MDQGLVFSDYGSGFRVLDFWDNGLGISVLDSGSGVE